MKNCFWRWVRNETSGERSLYLNGPIAEETWFGDEVTPKLFKDELRSGSGPVAVYINSPGGDVFAAAQIYNALMEYGGPVTVKIDGIAASAASVIAMAGGEVLMSPVSMLMVHNPATLAWGGAEEMLRAKALLDEVKESIINSYELKTGLSRAKLSHLMDNETWMNAKKAVELGFADKIMFTGEEEPAAGAPDNNISPGIMFSRAAVTNSLLGKLPKPQTKAPELPVKEPDPPEPVQPAGTPVDSLYQRLNLISH